MTHSVQSVSVRDTYSMHLFYPVSDLCLNPPLSSPIGVMCQRGGVCAWGAAYIEGKSYLHSRSDTYSNIIYILIIYTLNRNRSNKSAIRSVSETDTS